MAQMRFAGSRPAANRPAASNTRPLRFGGGQPQQPQQPQSPFSRLQQQHNAGQRSAYYRSAYDSQPNPGMQGAPTTRQGANQQALGAMSAYGQTPNYNPQRPPTPGSWGEAMQRAGTAGSQLLQLAGMGIANAWSNATSNNGQGSGWVTPQQRSQAVATYNNMRPPASYTPNQTNPYAAPGFIQSNPTQPIGGGGTMSPQAQAAWAARSRGAGQTAANPPGFYAQRAQAQAAQEQEYYRQVRANKAYSDRLTGEAAWYLGKPKGQIDGLSKYLQPPAGGGGGYVDYGGYGGGGGGGYTEPAKEFWNAMANWNIARPQGG